MNMLLSNVLQSRVIIRTAERQDHQDCRTQACHCRPTLLSTYHTSSPHHMNHSHHPPLPLQQKMLWGHAPLLCAHHSAWTEREQDHSRWGLLKSSLWWKDVHHKRKHKKNHYGDVQINLLLKGVILLGILPGLKMTHWGTSKSNHLTFFIKLGNALHWW